MFFKKKKESQTVANIMKCFGDPDLAPLRSGATISATRFDLRLYSAGAEWVELLKVLEPLIERAHAAYKVSPAPGNDPDVGAAFKEVHQVPEHPSFIAENWNETYMYFSEMEHYAKEENYTLLRSNLGQFNIFASSLANKLVDICFALLEDNRNPWGALAEFHEPIEAQFKNETILDQNADERLASLYGFHAVEENIRLCRYYVSLIAASCAYIEHHNDPN